MGSKSSKWLAAGLAATALAVVPAGAVAKLDYSKNSVSGQYLPSPAALVAPDVSPAVPPRQVVRVGQPDSGFAWGDAFAGAGVALLLALTGSVLVRRRHASPLAS
jgi:hypothetical protein